MAKYVIIFFGVCFMIIGLVMGMHYLNIFINGGKANGVIKNTVVRHYGDGDAVHLTVRYAFNGQSVSVECSNTGDTNNIIGDTIEVFFDKNDPGNVYIKRSHPYVFSFFFGGIGYLLLAMGIYIHRHPKAFDFIDWE